MHSLTIFARPPVAGRVKTRLVPALPARLAAALYAGLLVDTLAAAAGSRADERVIAWSETEGAPGPPKRFTAIAQAAGDLGARLEDAFARAFAGGATRAVVVGSDAPGLRAADLDAAFDALEHADLVLGPAVDGGYWLVGLTRAQPTLFRDVPWSTADVLAATQRQAAAAKLRVAMLRTLADVDEPGDVAALVGACARDPQGACSLATRAALTNMGLLA